MQKTESSFSIKNDTIVKILYDSCINTENNNPFAASFSICSKSIINKLLSYTKPEIIQKYDLTAKEGLVAVALPYNCEQTSSDSNMLDIAAFAGSNHYAALVRLLQSVAKRLSALSCVKNNVQFFKKNFSTVVNSEIPEKIIANFAGMGFIGKSSLFVSKDYGPSCVLGAILLPKGFCIELPNNSDYFLCSFPKEAASNVLLSSDFCSTCNLCVVSCPTKAIKIEGGLELTACIQYWTTKEGEIPKIVLNNWQKRLYGCGLCVSACPFSKRVTLPIYNQLSLAQITNNALLPREKRPGTAVSLDFIKNADSSELKQYFHRTALGLSWFGPVLMKRNAQIVINKQSANP